MGYYDDTPIMDLIGKLRICYGDYREAMATIGRLVPDQEIWRTAGGWGTGIWATSGIS